MNETTRGSGAGAASTEVAVAVGAGAPASSPTVLTGVTATLVLVGIFLAILMGAMDSLVVSTVLPTIAGDLHQVDGVTFVAGSYLVSSTISIPIFARLSDIASRRNVFLVGLAIFMVGSALAGLSQNLSELIAFRAMQGFGGGGVFPVAIAMVAVMFPPSTRARVTGILSGAAGLAIVLGPLVGSYIVSVATWRWVFYINLPFGILAAAVLLFAVGPLRPTTPGGFDVPGAALLSGWVGALMVALVEVSDSGLSWTDPRIVALLAAAVVLFPVFLWWELRTLEPLVPLRLMKQRTIAATSGTMFFTGIVFSSLITFLSVFVGIVLLGNGPSAAGDIRDIIYFLAIPLVLGAAISGQILTRLSYRKVIVPGLVVGAVSAFFLTDLSLSTPLWHFAFGFIPDGGLILPLIPMGFGLGFSLAGPTIAVQNDAPRDKVGAAIGLTRFLQSLGAALGISLLTTFDSWRVQTLSKGATTPGAVADAMVTAYNEIFLILAICVVIALGFGLLFTGRVPQKSSKTGVQPGSISGAEAAPVGS
ncbi:MAG: MFS transporter [Nitrososphaerales archaeon]|jgi:EmrB/QacA subfamily drug resistance transporter